MVITTQDLLIMLQDPGVELYLFILAIAVWRCKETYYKKLALSSSKNQKNIGNSSLPPSTVYKFIPPIMSVFILGFTWFYIFRFILTNQFTSESYFDDAYKDVLNHHYFSSTQLLTWAIVSVIWISTEETHSADGIPFLFYGFLGAMGASFVFWIPSRLFCRKHTWEMKRTYTPITFAITSLLAFYCILNIRPCQDSTVEGCSKDQGFGSFKDSFRFYLHGLHYVLLLPIGILLLVPARKQIQIDSSLLYGVIGLVISWWHLSQLIDANDLSKDNAISYLYRIPQTDCQKSIHIDLICCSALTLYAIYHDGRKVNGIDHSLRNVTFAAFFMPIISPAAVLSFHLCIKQFIFTHRDIIGQFQRQIAQQRRKQNSLENISSEEYGWCNLGMWKNKDGKEARSYDEACENLAMALADEVRFESGDGVLSIGCGVTGKELDFYYSRFQLGHITGIDPHVNIDASSFDNQNIQKIKASVEDLICENENVPFFRPNLFNTIVALDNIYHYTDKIGFFRYCKKMLTSCGGKVAVTDIILGENKSVESRCAAWKIKLALSVMGVSSDVYSTSEYKSHLTSLGFSNISFKSIGKEVFGGWVGFLPSILLENLDYCIVTAEVQTEPSPREEKKRVAIIGSGMAGQSAVHTIYSSARSKDIEVTVFEAQKRPGLAGNTRKIGNQLVDVPARMAALGYYRDYMKLIQKLGIRYQVVKTDCIFHGNDGNGGYVKHIYERSSLSNFIHAVTVGGLVNLWKMVVTFSSIPSLLSKSSSQKDDGFTFGDWLHEHLKLYPLSPKSNDPTKHQGWSFSHFARHENAFLYMVIGSFGWMLSCTYRQLISCPSEILLPYIDGLGLTRFLGIFNKGSVVRIEPSIKALEHALMYGVKLECNSKIFDLDESKNINGIEYDAIIVATEADAVPRVVRACGDVFSKFHYHPSTIYLHNDQSLLPDNKSDWRTWEVRMEPDHEEPQLTFWLNRYYNHIDFKGDVFQTWAASKPPKPEYTIAKFDMSRVIHTSASKDLVRLIEKEQGKGGFYYAGSYTIYGMGLLEQATKSGRLAGEHALKNLFKDENAK